MDYGSGPYPVTVPAENTTNIPFDVKINNDNILEGNKTFRITINATSLPGCVNRANPYEATVTIVDDDGNSVLSISTCICIVKADKCYSIQF